MHGHCRVGLTFETILSVKNPEDPNTLNRGVKPKDYKPTNKFLWLLVPIMLTMLALGYGLPGGGISDGEIIGIILIQVGLPLYLGFIISLRWHDLHPLIYVPLGVAVSFSVFCTVLAIQFTATCLAYDPGL